MLKATVPREPEWRAVADLCDRALRGPAALVVEGEAGIGKTTLMLAAIEHATRAGFTVLSAHGSHAEVGYAYAPVADLLDGVDDATLAALPPRQRLALDGAPGGLGIGGPGTDERVVGAAFCAVVEQLRARSPVLLAVDDAQWLDPSSRAVIGFAVRRLVERTALLATVRVGSEPDPAGTPSWPTVARPDILTRTRMRPLSVGGVQALIAARWGRMLPRPAITRIHHISGGNPMFVLELARAEFEDGRASSELPEGLVALVRGRLGALPPDVHAVLLAAACAASPTVEILSRVTEVAPERVVELIESVEALDVVVLDGHHVRFTHPLFATGVYADAAPSQRRRTHRALAEIVDHPELRARHLALSATTGNPATLTALDAAADALAARGALAAAAELVDLAINLGDTPQRRIRSAELHFRSGSVSAARSHLLAALDALPAGSLRALALAQLGAVKAYDDDLPGAIETLTEASAQATDAPGLRLMCQVRLSLALGVADRMAEAVETACRAVALAEELDAPGLRSQGLALWVTATFIQGEGVHRDALRTAVQLEDPLSGATTSLRATATQAVISAYIGDLETADAQIRAVRHAIATDGTEIDLVWVDNRITAIEIWSGRYTQAAHTAHAAVQRAEQLGARLSLATAWTKRATVAAFQGRDHDARADAHAAIEAASAMGAGRLIKEPSRVLAFLAVSRGDYSAALAVLRPLLDKFDPPRELEIEGGEHLPDAIETLTALGYLDEAEALADALQTHGAQRDRPWMMAVGARGRGMILAARADLPAAQRELEAALAHHDRLPMPFERARTQLLLGQLQRRRRHRGAAGDTLTAALATFDSLGTPLWAARARAELARLKGTRGEGHQLTAAEQRTAQLAAQGRSNRQIAAELFLSEKTVEANLSSVYRKLGIRSRAALAAHLGLGTDKGAAWPAH